MKIHKAKITCTSKLGWGNETSKVYSTIKKIRHCIPDTTKGYWYYRGILITAIETPYGVKTGDDIDTYIKLVDKSHSVIHLAKPLKRRPGRPRTSNLTEEWGCKLSPEAIAIVRSKKNQAKYVNDLILKESNNE